LVMQLRNFGAVNRSGYLGVKINDYE
jgi:hypothetical protein